MYDDRIAGSMDDFEPPDSPPKPQWHTEDLKQDDAIGGIHEEVVRRINTLGEVYPFTNENGRLVHMPSNDLVYEFLLAICNADNVAEGEYVEMPRLFERLSAKLVAAYFGPESRSIHTGSPRDPEIGRSFREAMENVAKETGEWRWNPPEDLPSNPGQGDNGCDFVVWPVHADQRRIGQLFVFGQCACGNNWTSKWRDLRIKKLERWFHPFCTVDPVRSFATPFYVTDAMLREASGEAGLVFDRARLAGISSRSPAAVSDKKMRKKMERLIELVC